MERFGEPGDLRDVLARKRRRQRSPASDDVITSPRSQRPRSHTYDCEGYQIHDQRPVRSRTNDLEGSHGYDLNQRLTRARTGPDFRDENHDPDRRSRQYDRATEEPGKQHKRDDSVSTWPRERAESGSSGRLSSAGSDGPRVRSFETDPVVLARRQKQIDYGKNTLVYQEYTTKVPIAEREDFRPRTPKKHHKMSRRRWDSAIKCWRIHLHYWDDPVTLARLRSRSRDSESSDDAAGQTSPGDVQDAAAAGVKKMKLEVKPPAVPAGPQGDPWYVDGVAGRQESPGGGLRARPEVPPLKLEPADDTPVNQGGTKQDTGHQQVTIKQEPGSDVTAGHEPQRVVIKQEPGCDVTSHEPQRVAIKQEPGCDVTSHEPQRVVIKQEPGSDVTSHEPQQIRVKQEPDSGPLGNPGTQPVTIKQEPDGEPQQITIKQEPMDDSEAGGEPADDLDVRREPWTEYEEQFDWADDVEAMARELLGP